MTSVGMGRLARAMWRDAVAEHAASLADAMLVGETEVADAVEMIAITWLSRAMTAPAPIAATASPGQYGGH